MAKVKAVPIKCDNKRRDEAMFGNRNCNTCVVQQDVLVQVAICPCKLFLNGLLEPRTSGREDKRASEQTGRALSRDISGFGCFRGNNGKRKPPPQNASSHKQQEGLFAEHGCRVEPTPVSR